MLSISKRISPQKRKNSHVPHPHHIAATKSSQAVDTPRQCGSNFLQLHCSNCQINYAFGACAFKVRVNYPLSFCDMLPALCYLHPGLPQDPF